MDLRKVRLILRKEWLQLRQQRVLLLSLIFLPILFTILPLAIILVMRFVPTDELHEIDQLLRLVGTNPALAGASGQEVLQAAIGQPASVLLFMLPVILPSIIASYSIVGEKVNRTLEPVLATPVTTLELLVGKILASLLPAVAVTWGFGLVLVGGLLIVTLSPAVFMSIVNLSWLLLVLLCAPLLALATIAVTVAASSRASDPRSAQQISALVILPIVLVLVGQFTGLLALSPVVSLIAAFVLALLALGALWLATRVFQRESILTRWN